MTYAADQDGAMRPSSPGITRRQQLGLLAGGAAAGLLGGSAAAHAASFPGRTWQTASPQSQGFDTATLNKALQFIEKKGGSGLVIRHGYKVAGWGDLHQPYELYSASKFMGSTLVMAAMDDGLVHLDDRAAKLMPGFGTPPEVNVTGHDWAQQVTVTDLVAHTAGFPDPAGFGKILFQPGTYHRYSNCGANWMADVLTTRYKRDLNNVMWQRVLKPIGVGAQDFHWRPNLFRPQTLAGVARREFASGIFISADAFARIGLLMLRLGNWNGRQLLPKATVAQAIKPNPKLLHIKDFGNTEPAPCTRYWFFISDNGDGSLADFPRDTFLGWGKDNTTCLVVPSSDLVLVRLGNERFGTYGESRTGINNYFKGFIHALGR